MTYREKLADNGRANVTMFIKPLNLLRLEDIDFKLDTGADLTTINKKELQALGYDQTWITKNIHKDKTRTISSAGGRSAPACYVRISVVNLFSRDFRNWPFYIREDTDKDFPNLLGIDMLSNFDFTFSYSTGYLEIKPIATKTIELPLLNGQEVNEPVIEYISHKR